MFSSAARGYNLKDSDSSHPVSPSDAARDLWRHTLSQIPSLFGKLVYLASLRDPNTGEYVHYGLATVFGAVEANLAMKASHQEVFGAWLAFGLEAQKRDLDLYVAGLEPERKKVVESWSKIEPYRSLAPDTALPFERQLFTNDLEILLSLLRNELGVSLPGRDA
jgi:hypothetical protein